MVSNSSKNTHFRFNWYLSSVPINECATSYTSLSEILADSVQMALANSSLGVTRHVLFYEGEVYDT